MTKKVNKKYPSTQSKMDINMNIDMTLAIFGAIYEGDPMGGDSILIPETMYPTLDSFAKVMDVSADIIHTNLLKDGFVRMMTKEGWVIVTHAYTHDNNTTRTLQ